MEVSLGAAIGFALLVALAVLLANRGRRGRIDDADGLPLELQGAELAYAEQTFRSRRHRFVARLDRAYRTPAGLQLVELKTRARDTVYLSDIIELSAQRIAVEGETFEPVTADAWVVVEDIDSGRRLPHKVRLLDAREVASMRQRYGDILSGEVLHPRPAGLASQCALCHHRGRCAAVYRRGA
jgi:hypothetical protein